MLARCGIEYENQTDISDAAIHQAYIDADVVTFISLAEGFGLPIIEANAIGRPVITSTLAPMCDVAGRAACLVNPVNLKDIRDGIWSVLHNDAYREALVSHGYDNAKRFAARQVAEQYAQLYLKVMTANRLRSKEALRPPVTTRSHGRRLLPWAKIKKWFTLATGKT